MSQAMIQKWVLFRRMMIKWTQMTKMTWMMPQIKGVIEDAPIISQVSTLHPKSSSHCLNHLQMYEPFLILHVPFCAPNWNLSSLQCHFEFLTRTQIALLPNQNLMLSSFYKILTIVSLISGRDTTSMCYVLKVTLISKLSCVWSRFCHINWLWEAWVGPLIYFEISDSTQKQS